LLTEYSAREVTAEVLTHLERHRAAIVGDDALVRRETRVALARVESAYVDSGLPQAYLRALIAEVESALPERWRGLATGFSDLEARGFGIWRGGDLVSRVVYVFAGLAVGGLCVAAPFIPIWEKWFPFALAVAGWWLPDAQAWLHRRRYARRLGDIVRDMAGAQPALDRVVTVADLLPPDDKATPEGMP
jgi:hypothetical protein